MLVFTRPESHITAENEGHRINLWSLWKTYLVLM